MDSNNIFGKRLRNAREMKGFSLAELAGRMSDIVSRQAIHKYESGQMMPDSTVLLSLSDVLGVSADYFFRPFAEDFDNIEFRKKAKLSVKDRVAIEQTAKDRIERYLEIEDLCNIHRDVNIFPQKKEVKERADVVELVSRIRKNWGLGKDGITDVIGLLESKGIIVIEFDAPDSFDGLSGMAGNNIVIILNKTKNNAERKRFTALHELGHLVMDFDESVDEREKESFCHLFASEFLIPQESFQKLFRDALSKRLNMYLFADIQRSFGISIDALMRKAADSNMIPKNTLKSYHIRKNSNPDFKNFVDRSFMEIEHPDRFETMVFDAYYKHIVSASKAANLLDVPINNILESEMYV